MEGLIAVCPKIDRKRSWMRNMEPECDNTCAGSILEADRERFSDMKAHRKGMIRGIE